MTVKVPVPELPAASDAVAVHTLVVAAVTDGAVNVEPEKLPPFVQATEGPLVTPTLSVAVNVELPVAPDSTVKLFGLNETTGRVVSAAGGGGGVAGGTDELPLPPPQAVRVAADITNAP